MSVLHKILIVIVIGIGIVSVFCGVVLGQLHTSSQQVSCAFLKSSVLPDETRELLTKTNQGQLPPSTDACMFRDIHGFSIDGGSSVIALSLPGLTADTIQAATAWKYEHPVCDRDKTILRLTFHDTRPSRYFFWDSDVDGPDCREEENPNGFLVVADRAYYLFQDRYGTLAGYFMPT